MVSVTAQAARPAGRRFYVAIGLLGFAVALLRREPELHERLTLRSPMRRAAVRGTETRRALSGSLVGAAS